MAMPFFRAVCVSLLSLLRHWCIWRHLEAGCNQNPSRSTKKPVATPRLGSARRSISSKKFAQPVRVAHGGWVLKIEGGPQDFENGFDVFFPMTSFSSENLSFPLVNPAEIGKLGMFCYFFGGLVQAGLSEPRAPTKFKQGKYFNFRHTPKPGMVQNYWNPRLKCMVNTEHCQWCASIGTPCWPKRPRCRIPAQCWNPPICQSTG